MSETVLPAVMQHRNDVEESIGIYGKGILRPPSVSKLVYKIVNVQASLFAGQYLGPVRRVGYTILIMNYPVDDVVEI